MHYWHPIDIAQLCVRREAIKVPTNPRWRVRAGASKGHCQGRLDTNNSQKYLSHTNKIICTYSTPIENYTSQCAKCIFQHRDRHGSVVLESFWDLCWHCRHLTSSRIEERIEESLTRSLCIPAGPTSLTWSELRTLPVCSVAIRILMLRSIPKLSMLVCENLKLPFMEKHSDATYGRCLGRTHRGLGCNEQVYWMKTSGRYIENLNAFQIW